MSILPSDLILYGSANMQDTDAGSQGGAIDTAKRVLFTEVSPAGQVQYVSSNSGDTTQTVTVTAKDAAGVTVSEVKTLNGQTVVAGTQSINTLLKAVKSASCAGDVAVEAATATRTGTAQGGAAATASLGAYITLDASASGADDTYNGQVLRTTGGTGPNQIRWIVKYEGATKRAYVNRDWGTVPDGTTTFRVSQGMCFEKSPVEVTTIRRIHYNAAADAPGGSARDYYEKVFAKNIHGTLALTSAQVVEAADPSGKYTFALETTLDGSGTSTDRRTAPASGVGSFDSAAKNVANSQNLSAGSAQGIWIKLSLAAGDAANRTSYTPRVTGNSI